MLKVLTAEQMREVDRLTTTRYGVPSIQLMENAARSVQSVAVEKLGGSVEGRSILVLCGKGNNGGDGAALARMLWQDGAAVTLLLFGRVEHARGDAKVNFERLRSLGGDGNLRVHEDDEDLLELLETALGSGKTDLLIDALFGTGLSKELTGVFAEAIRRLEHHQPRIISVDLPSGLDADRGVPIGANVRAETTVTFTAPKAANVLPPAARSNGELVIANIGSPRELIEEQRAQLFVSESADVGAWLRRTRFQSGDYKNRRGHALIVAGSEDYSGAAVMCGNSAMRSGVGLTTLLVPASCRTEVASRVIPEVIVKTLAETDGEVSCEAFALNQETIQKADAILVGPGLKATDKGVERFVREIVLNRKCPVVIDAGALSDGARALWPESTPSVRTEGTALHPLILTPHEGEFMRLLGTDDKEAIKDRVAAVREYAADHNTILVLKGERVLIGSPDGRVVVNPTGNSGVGKAGNGDTLAGILAGFVAQAVRSDADIFETVAAAVYVAGMAGDAAAGKFGKRIMTASDVRECLSEVFRAFEENDSR